ncbi:MAG: DUF222 domain-containing protein, partial [Mycobacteriales bacterium]
MQTWADAERLVSSLAAACEPDRIPVPDAEALLTTVSSMEARLWAVKARLAARVAEAGGWRTSGTRTPAEELARRTRVSIGEARRLLDTGARLETQPEIAAAAAAGALSSGQVVLVSDAAAAAPEETAALLATATDSETSFASLREACLAAKAGADPDPEATHRRIHAGRGLRFWTDGEGAGNF